MRADERAHSFAAMPVPQVSTLLTRLVVAAVATIALLLVWRPARLHAQGTSAPASEQADSTHVVKAGETLWGLAAKYYGDGHQWQALARRNGIPVTDEPPLKVGMRLRVPAHPPLRGGNAAEAAAAPADSTVPKAALAKATEAPPPVAGRAPAGSLAAQTVGRGNASPAGAKAAAKSVAAKSVAAKSAAAEPASSPASEAPPGQPDTARADLSPTTGTIMGKGTARRIGLVDQAAAMDARKPSEVVTVFHRDLPDAAEAERRTRAVLRPNTPAPRVAEYYSAPFVAGEKSLEKLGRIAARVGSPADPGDAYPQRAIKTDEVELQAPEKQAYKVGDRLLAFGTPAALEKGQMVVMPTGILEVIKAEPGKPALALVRRQSGRIEEGQQLITAPAASAPWVKAIRLDTPDVTTTIRWLDPQEAQPTLQSHVIIGAGSAKGLAAGDELSIYRRIAKGTTEMIAATARVVRVERDFATAIITKQYQTDIAVGMPVRRHAKAP